MCGARKSTQPVEKFGCGGLQCTERADSSFSCGVGSRGRMRASERANQADKHTRHVFKHLRVLWRSPQQQTSLLQLVRKNVYGSVWLIKESCLDLAVGLWYGPCEREKSELSERSDPAPRRRSFNTTNSLLCGISSTVGEATHRRRNNLASRGNIIEITGKPNPLLFVQVL